MGYDNNTNSSFISILIGITVGAVIAYAILTRNQSQSLSQSQQYQNQNQQLQLHQPTDIPRVDDVIKKLTNTDNEVKNDKEIAKSPISLYKNNEKWEIVRNSEGSIISINVIRDVKKI